MLSTVSPWLVVFNYFCYSQGIFPQGGFFFCNCILFGFIGISEHVGIAILISNSVVTNLVLVSSQNVKSLSLRNFSLNFSKLTNENKIRCQVRSMMSSLKLCNRRCLTQQSVAPAVVDTIKCGLTEFFSFSGLKCVFNKVKQ